MAQNVNSGSYWDAVYREEQTRQCWRTYPASFALIKHIVKPYKKVLELGCGLGVLGWHLKDDGHDYEGIDGSSVAVERCLSLGLNASVAMLPPIPGGARDVIVATEFLEHFHKPRKLLAECVLVAPVLVISVPDDCLGHEECAEHYQRFTEASLRALLREFYKHVDIYHVVDVMPGNVRTPSLVAIGKQ